MAEAVLDDGLITNEALETLRERIGTKLRIDSVFNEVATKDAIRKFVDGIGDANPLWRDEQYASRTCYGSMAAPPSWLYSVFPAWVLQGLPGVHAYHTSTEWEFLRPIMLDDRITPDCIFTGFNVTRSQLAGRSLLERQEARYWNHREELVAKAMSTGLRAERAATREAGKHNSVKLPHPWTEAELGAIEQEMLSETIRGCETRYFEDVEVGERIGAIVRGPLGLTDIIAYCIGASPVRIQAQNLALRRYRKHPAWAFRDPNTFALEPIYSVHYNPAAAKASGLPYPFDTAVQRHSWLLQMLTNWMGDDGWIKRSYAKYKGFVFLSDVLWISGKIVKKYVDDDGEACVDIRTSAVNQRGEEVMPGTSTVALPSREHDTRPVDKRLQSRERR